MSLFHTKGGEFGEFGASMYYLSPIKHFQRLNLHGQGVIATMSRKRDWSSFQPRYGVNLFVSHMKAASPYVNLWLLGDLQSFDMHTDTVPGICFILPDPLASEPSWRLRLVLERDVMGVFVK